MADTELAEGPATAAEAGWGVGLVQVCLYQEKTSSWHGPCYYSLGEVSWKGITAIAICAGQRPPVQLHARVKRNLGDAGADGLPGKNMKDADTCTMMSNVFFHVLGSPPPAPPAPSSASSFFFFFFSFFFFVFILRVPSGH